MHMQVTEHVEVTALYGRAAYSFVPQVAVLVQILH
jgi:hypothetical protein